MSETCICNPYAELDAERLPNCPVCSPPPIRHDGKHTRRLTDTQSFVGRREIAFAKKWKEHNAPKIEGSALNWILHAFPAPKDHPPSGLLFGDVVADGPLTQDEATVAATVVQWLGTNVGFCFLEETLRECGYQVVRK